MLDSKAAVAAIGTLKKLPSYSDIEIGLLDKDVRNIKTKLVRFKSLICRDLCPPKETSSSGSDEDKSKFYSPKRLYTFSSDQHFITFIHIHLVILRTQ